MARAGAEVDGVGGRGAENSWRSRWSCWWNFSKVFSIGIIYTVYSVARWLLRNSSMSWALRMALRIMAHFQAQIHKHRYRERESERVRKRERERERENERQTHTHTFSMTWALWMALPVTTHTRTQTHTPAHTHTHTHTYTFLPEFDCCGWCFWSWHTHTHTFSLSRTHTHTHTHTHTTPCGCQQPSPWRWTCRISRGSSWATVGRRWWVPCPLQGIVGPWTRRQSPIISHASHTQVTSHLTCQWQSPLISHVSDTHLSWHTSLYHMSSWICHTWRHSFMHPF